MNKKLKTNPFDKKIRGLEYYKKLQAFAEEESDNSFENLGLFIRNVIIEQNSQKSLAHELRKYDLLLFVQVDINFPNRFSIASKIECCTQIYNSQNSKSITIEKFLSAPIIQWENIVYTLQDFVFAINYNGSLHWESQPQPNQPDLSKLYNNVIYKIPEIFLRLTHDIARCLVVAYKEIFEKFNGDNSGYSDIMSRQPRFINEDQGNTTCWFNKSYLQIPVCEQVNHGIRICLKLQMQNTIQQGFLFYYGNRHKRNISLSCEHNLKYLIFKTLSHDRQLVNKIIRISVDTEMFQKPFTIEMALYKNGYLSIAVNEYLKHCEQIPTNFSIYDGKLIIGANLDGENFGNFLCSVNSIEAINTQNIIHTIFMGGLRQLSGLDGRQLSPVTIKRPALQ